MNSLEKGFVISHEAGTRTSIVYRPPSKSAIVAFLSIFLPVFLLVLLQFIIDPSWWISELRSDWAKQNYTELAFNSALLLGGWLAGLIAFLCFSKLLLLNLFGRISIVLDDTQLELQTSVLGFKKTQQIEIDQIHSLNQVKDGGDGDDSFPSYGLVLALHKQKLFSQRKQIWLLQRQDWSKSAWLGEQLAMQLDLDFTPVEKSD